MKRRKEDAEDSKNFEVSIAYIHGRLEAQIEAFAQSLGIPARFLTNRLGTLLLVPEGGEVLRVADHLPVVRRKTAKRSKAVAKVAVVSRPRSKASSSGKGPRAYWAAMTPKQRSVEMKRRMSIRDDARGEAA